MTQSKFRSLMLRLLALAILALWICYLGVFGAELFTTLYKVPCANFVLPLPVYAFLLGCISFVAFTVFRALAGSFDCRQCGGDGRWRRPRSYNDDNDSESSTVTSTNATLMYFAHTLAAFVCLVTTGLGVARIESLSCAGYKPGVAPFWLVCAINALNGFLSAEQFGRQNVRLVTPSQIVYADGAENWRSSSSLVIAAAAVGTQSPPVAMAAPTPRTMSKTD